MSVLRLRRGLRRAAWGFVLLCLIGCTERLPTEATVRHVIDGDTVELADGRHVRYLGIDTPELRRRDAAGVWHYEPEPFGEEAKAFNRSLVEGRRAHLEYDVQPYDKYQRLLAYVTVDHRFVSEEIVQQGLATVLTIPPNVRYVERLQAAQRAAREARRGLWARP